MDRSKRRSSVDRFRDAVREGIKNRRASLDRIRQRFKKTVSDVTRRFSVQQSSILEFVRRLNRRGSFYDRIGGVEKRLERGKRVSICSCILLLSSSMFCYGAFLFALKYLVEFLQLEDAQRRVRKVRKLFGGLDDAILQQKMDDDGLRETLLLWKLVATVKFERWIRVMRAKLDLACASAREKVASMQAGLRRVRHRFESKWRELMASEDSSDEEHRKSTI